jgi:hypothetical protein
MRIRIIQSAPSRQPTKEKARWTTLHGTTHEGSHGVHVQIKDSKIVAGPRHMVGKKLSELQVGVGADFLMNM